MKKYDVSAIVPLYKGDKYVGHLFELFENNVKFANQNGVNITLEVIMINDYPDEIININDSFKDFDVVYLINEKNIGIHETRVKGINVAKGEFIFMFDQDDEITDNFLFSQLTLIRGNQNTSMVIANGIVQHPTYERKIYEKRAMHLLSKYEWFYALFDNRIISPGQCLIRKNAIPKFWLVNSMKRNGADDLLLWLLIFEDQRFAKPTLNPECLYTHVNTDNNTSLDLKGMYASVDEMLDLLINNKICSPRIIKLIGYRNDYQKGIKSNYKAFFYEKCLVHAIYFLRKIKNES